MHYTHNEWPYLLPGDLPLVDKNVQAAFESPCFKSKKNNSSEANVPSYKNLNLQPTEPPYKSNWLSPKLQEACAALGLGNEDLLPPSNLL